MQQISHLAAKRFVEQKKNEEIENRVHEKEDFGNRGERVVDHGENDLLNE